MIGRRRKAIEQQEATERSNRALWVLVLLTVASGLFGLVGFLRAGEPSWPKPFAFGWFAVFATGLLIELVRRRRAAQQAAGADGAQKPRR